MFNKIDQNIYIFVDVTKKVLLLSKLSIFILYHLNILLLASFYFNFYKYKTDEVKVFGVEPASHGAPKNPTNSGNILIVDFI